MIEQWRSSATALRVRAEAMVVPEGPSFRYSQRQELLATAATVMQLANELAAVGAVGDPHLRQNWIDDVVQQVAELPDRTSPDDWPDAMLVTADELRSILGGAVADPALPQLEWTPEQLADLRATALTMDREHAARVLADAPALRALRSAVQQYEEATPFISGATTTEVFLIEAALAYIASLPPPVEHEDDHIRHAEKVIDNDGKHAGEEPRLQSAETMPAHIHANSATGEK